MKKILLSSCVVLSTVFVSANRYGDELTRKGMMVLSGKFVARWSFGKITAVKFPKQWKYLIFRENSISFSPEIIK
jgi:hypothetical protein